MVFATAAFVAVPASVTGSLFEDWRRLAADPGQACFDHERRLIADAAGKRLVAYSVVGSDANEVTIRYRAMNGAEPALDEEVTCALQGGRFSAEDTIRRREHDQAAKRIDRLVAEFHCLERKKAILNARRGDDRAVFKVTDPPAGCPRSGAAPSAP